MCSNWDTMQLKKREKQRNIKLSIGGGTVEKQIIQWWFQKLQFENENI